MDRPTKFMKRSWGILCLTIVFSMIDNSAGGDRPFAPALSPPTKPLPSPKSTAPSPRIKDSRSLMIPLVGSPNSLVTRNFLGPAASPPRGIEHHLSPRNHGPSIVSSPAPAPAFHDGLPTTRFPPSPSPSASKGPPISPSPSSNPVAPPVPARRRHFPPDSSASPAESPIQRQGPSHSPSISAPVPSPSPGEGESSSPVPAPSALADPPALFYPPPPPGPCQLPQPCEDPFTNPLLGSPCVCVLPIKVKLRLSVALYLFFPLVSELAREIGEGVFLDATQVHIMGANAATEHPDKTIVLVDLVPRRRKFDHATAMLTFDRFWRKQVDLNAAYFGDYDVLNVQYPGLPKSPPVTDMIEDPGGKDKSGTLEPFGVDVHKRGEGKKPSASIVAVLVLSAVFAVTSCAAIFWFLLWKLKQRDSARLPLLPARHSMVLPRVKKALGIGGTGGPAFLVHRAETATDSLSSYSGGPRTFSLGEMERATGNFDESRVVGEGGFGRVYKGVLEGGTLVAVKVLKRVDQRGGKEFLAEIEMLSRLHHRNLVKLFGLCAEDNNRCLVYELIPNGSVSSHLHGADKVVAPLDWATRVKIALGSAKALAYLHEDSSPPVIHRDFKSSNILLDQNFTPKVSDFGLARTALNDEGKDHISTRVVGTFGYVAPEYALTGHLLVKSDVYSYGVVLLELLTGKKPVDMSQPPGQENLVAWAHPLLTNKEDLEAIVDPSLGLNLPFDDVAKLAAIASMCVQPEVSQRPSMGEVVQALKLVYNDGDGLTEMEDDVT